MDAYPLNLILAVATASATIFLGFLPTKDIKSTFFAREAGKAIFAWGLVALTSPHKILHYPCLLAFFCFAAWWHFRRDRALNGKMWLSLASGLGISIGVMFILAVTPQANPPDLPLLNETLLLASIYLGGAIIGLAYVCLMLVQSTNAGVTQSLVHRFVGLLLTLTFIHSFVIFASWLVSAFLPKVRAPEYPRYSSDSFISIHFDQMFYLLVSLTVVVLPLLAYRAYRDVQFSSHVQPTRALIALVLFGFLSEIIARLFVY